MTVINVPLTVVLVRAPAPDIVQTCDFFSPGAVDPIAPEAPDPTPDPGTGVWLPAPPGVVYGDLPSAPAVVDTAPTNMIGCINSTGDNPQERLGILFPSPSAGDGVIERTTNHFWVFDGVEWIDVGSTPGPTMTVGGVLRPYDETVLVVSGTQTGLAVESFNYPLAVTWSFDFRTFTGLQFQSQLATVVPVPSTQVDVETPEVVVTTT